MRKACRAAKTSLGRVDNGIRAKFASNIQCRRGANRRTRSEGWNPVLVNSTDYNQKRAVMIFLSPVVFNTCEDGPLYD